MKTDLRIFVAAIALFCACDKGTTDIGALDDAGCADPTAASGESGGAPGGEAVPMVVDCSFHWQGVDTNVRIEPNAESDGSGGDEPLAFGTLLVHTYFSDDEFEGRSFSIGVYKEDGSVGMNALYQMDRTKPLANEFWGDHGFTGLHSVSDPETDEGLQYACFASDPDDPIHVWED